MKNEPATGQGTRRVITTLKNSLLRTFTSIYVRESQLTTRLEAMHMYCHRTTPRARLEHATRRQTDGSTPPRAITAAPTPIWETLLPARLHCNKASENPRRQQCWFLKGTLAKDITPIFVVPTVQAVPVQCLLAVSSAQPASAGTSLRIVALQVLEQVWLAYLGAQILGPRLASALAVLEPLAQYAGYRGFTASWDAAMMFGKEVAAADLLARACGWRQRPAPIDS